MLALVEKKLKRSTCHSLTCLKGQKQDKETHPTRISLVLRFLFEFHSHKESVRTKFPHCILPTPRPNTVQLDNIKFKKSPTAINI